MNRTTNIFNLLFSWRAHIRIALTLLISDFLIRAKNKMAHFDRFHGGRWATIAVFRRQGPAALQIMCQIIFRILFKNPFIIHPGSGSLNFTQGLIYKS